MTARTLSGDTTSAMLVHSLAISAASMQIDQGIGRIRTSTATNRNGDDLQVTTASISFGLLMDVVGNALALSTLKRIVSQHPRLTITSGHTRRDANLVVTLNMKAV